MMATEIKGFGAPSGHTGIDRGAGYAVNFLPRVTPEIAVDAIIRTAGAVKIGDGKIFARDPAQAAQVRTSGTGARAL